MDNVNEPTLVLYWIHLPEHTEEHLEGYIGITSNFERRVAEHKYKAPNTYFQNIINKYGWDNLVKEVIVSGPADDIIDLEKVFRPQEGIGWNLAAGGGMPPSCRGRFLSEETRERIGVKQRGDLNHNFGKTGSLNGNFKGVIVATHKKTSEVITLSGYLDILDAGFNYSHVYACVRGERKSHKGFTFNKESVEANNFADAR